MSDLPEAITALLQLLANAADIDGIKSAIVPIAKAVTDAHSTSNSNQDDAAAAIRRNSTVVRRILDNAGKSLIMAKTPEETATAVQIWDVCFEAARSVICDFDNVAAPPNSSASSSETATAAAAAGVLSQITMLRTMVLRSIGADLAIPEKAPASSTEQGAELDKLFRPRLAQLCGLLFDIVCGDGQQQPHQQREQRETQLATESLVAAAMSRPALAASVVVADTVLPKLREVVLGARDAESSSSSGVDEKQQSRLAKVVPGVVHLINNIRTRLGSSTVLRALQAGVAALVVSPSWVRASETNNVGGGGDKDGAYPLVDSSMWTLCGSMSQYTEKIRSTVGAAATAASAGESWATIVIETFVDLAKNYIAEALRREAEAAAPAPKKKPAAKAKKAAPKKKAAARGKKAARAESSEEEGSDDEDKKADEDAAAATSAAAAPPASFGLTNGNFEGGVATVRARVFARCSELLKLIADSHNATDIKIGTVCKFAELFLQSGIDAGKLLDLNASSAVSASAAENTVSAWRRLVSLARNSASHEKETELQQEFVSRWVTGAVRFAAANSALLLEAVLVFVAYGFAPSTAHRVVLARKAVAPAGAESPSAAAAASSSSAADSHHQLLTLAELMQIASKVADAKTALSNWLAISTSNQSLLRGLEALARIHARRAAFEKSAAAGGAAATATSADGAKQQDDDGSDNGDDAELGSSRSGSAANDDDGDDNKSNNGEGGDNDNDGDGEDDEEEEDASGDDAEDDHQSDAAGENNNNNDGATGDAKQKQDGAAGNGNNKQADAAAEKLAADVKQARQRQAVLLSVAAAVERIMEACRGGVVHAGSSLSVGPSWTAPELRGSGNTNTSSGNNNNNASSGGDRRSPRYGGRYFGRTGGGGGGGGGGRNHHGGRNGGGDGGSGGGRTGNNGGGGGGGRGDIAVRRDRPAGGGGGGGNRRSGGGGGGGGGGFGLMQRRGSGGGGGGRR